MSQNHPKATKFASFVAIGALVLVGALNAPKSAYAGNIQRCKYATASRTIKAPFTVPDGIAPYIPANTSGCIVWLNQTYTAPDGTEWPSYKVMTFTGKHHTMTIIVSKELDTDGITREYISLVNP